MTEKIFVSETIFKEDPICKDLRFCRISPKRCTEKRGWHGNLWTQSAKFWNKHLIYNVQKFGKLRNFIEPSFEFKKLNDLIFDVNWAWFLMWTGHWMTPIFGAYAKSLISKPLKQDRAGLSDHGARLHLPREVLLTIIKFICFLLGLLYFPK